MPRLSQRSLSTISPQHCTGESLLPASLGSGSFAVSTLVEIDQI